MKDHKVHVRIPAWRKQEVSEEFMRFAQNRVSFLQGVIMHQPLLYVLMCAYLQGIEDTVQVHARNPTLGKVEEYDG